MFPDGTRAILYDCGDSYGAVSYDDRWFVLLPYDGCPSFTGQGPELFPDKHWRIMVLTDNHDELFKPYPDTTEKDIDE